MSKFWELDIEAADGLEDLVAAQVEAAVRQFCNEIEVGIHLDEDGRPYAYVHSRNFCDENGEGDPHQLVGLDPEMLLRIADTIRRSA